MIVEKEQDVPLVQELGEDGLEINSPEVVTITDENETNGIYEHMLFVVEGVPPDGNLGECGSEEENDDSIIQDLAEEGGPMINRPNMDLNGSVSITDETVLNGNDIEDTNDTAHTTDKLPKKLTRKKSSNPETWQRNVRKRKYQAGEAYVSTKGKTVKEKTLTVKKDCLNTCKMKCSTKITNDERQALFSSFYTLKSQNEKTFYIANNTVRHLTARKKNDNINDDDTN